MRSIFSQSVKALESVRDQSPSLDCDMVGQGGQLGIDPDRCHDELNKIFFVMPEDLEKQLLALWVVEMLECLG